MKHVMSWGAVIFGSFTACSGPGETPAESTTTAALASEGGSLDFMQGHWTGCEGQWLHEKVISSMLGGSVVGANKVLQNGALVSVDYIDIKPNAGDTPGGVTLTFYTGTRVEAVAQCSSSPLSLACRTADGSFSNTITLRQGASADRDVLSMVKTFQGTATTLDLKRFSGEVPVCQ
jgi:hypothetical protein